MNFDSPRERTSCLMRVETFHERHDAGRDAGSERVIPVSVVRRQPHRDRSDTEEFDNGQMLPRRRHPAHNVNWHIGQNLDCYI